MRQFFIGFEKKAGKEEMLAAALLGGGALGLGALAGHASHVNKKMDYARSGKNYNPKSTIDKHPKTTGALSLGIAPAVSHMSHRSELDMDNPKVRKVLKEHPMMAAPGF